eukprot:XP_011602209.1 PREDICTED: ATPase family AAA domain-containing protein 5 isoform X1 [Takifugu rubripes]
MAGVVAMASVIEDFDIQPCKKSQSDGGSPVVKTIPNNFSPVPKPFSPPRPSNIMDYFTRKAPTKTSSPEPLEGDCQKSRPCEKQHSLETQVKKPLQKRSRKSGKAAMKLNKTDLSQSTEKDCMIVEEQCHKERLSVQTDGKLFSGGEGINLIEEACFTGEKLEITATEIVSDIKKHHDEKSNIQSQLEIIELSPIVPSKDKAKKVKSNVPLVRRKQQQEETETESTLCDVSMEVNVDETSQLNNSTVTISFEEFVRSQSEDIDEKKIVENVPTATEKMDTNLDENIRSEEAVLQGSPQTVTIHAEVHAVSPKQDAVATKKVASIFNRRKGTTSPLELISPAQMEDRHKLPSSGPLVKWKSNVVLEEEDLELAILESESTPKCTDVERKQFMAAFKQPAVDGSKTKPGKSQGKTKQPIEKVEDITETEEQPTVPPTAEETSSISKKAAKNKLARKSQKKGENRTVRTLPAPVKELVNTDDGDGTQEIPVTSTPSTPAVRRSTRAAVVSQCSNPETPVRRPRQPSESKRAAVHPPAKTHRSKHGVFRAEMVCPPDVKQSPIRIKFVRVQKDVPTSKTESGCGTAGASNIPNNAKKRKQARKLVEKARVIQQSKKVTVEEKTNLRRSSRTEATAKRSYCEHEDSVICLDEDVMTTPKVAEKSKKSLRSLNDVLGKASSLCKDAKPLAGSKASSLGQEKTARKASAVISIFDDSSHESSTNSPDNDQSRARREFLKSGLPESLRKQIAKTTATKEAYSLSCSSFQPVTHTKQTLKDCPLWSLPWPQSSLLSHLQEFWYQTCSPLPPVCSSHLMKTKPACRVLHKLGSTQRPEISESVRHRLTEEVSTSNPLFPVQMFMSRLLKRRADHKQQCTAAEADPITRVKSSTLSAKSVGGKRKRKSEEEEIAVKVAKKQRRGEEEIVSQRSVKGSRMRRSQRSKPEQEKNDDANPAAKSEDDAVITILDEDTEKKDDVKEDVLWTDKYHPQHSSDIVGNARAVRRLHSWLREWKLRADREERRKQTEKKQGEDKTDSDWDCGEEEFQDGEDMLCNTLLITGPTGVGKTAAVYACAQELGFKVFEVNASSQRSGRLILSQLKEATQSHQVDGQGVNACKPSYFNSYSSSSSVRPGSSPKKVNSSRTVVSSPRKHPHSPKGVKKGDLAPTSLANFFKMGRPPNREAPNTKNNEKPSSCKNTTKANVFGSRDKVPAANPPVASVSKESISEEQSKKLATSLILFEEVDVIFDDDSGFLSAIKTFMTTTKRPVILTTSDPAFSSMFDGNFEEIHFKAPSVLDSSSFMQLLCLAEDIRTDQWDVSALLRHNGCDMRQSLLQLQFWARSGGGHCTDRPVTDTAKKAAKLEPLEPEAASDSVTSAVPRRDACCTESMLGLLNIAPERDIWQILRTCRPDEASWWDLLTNCKRRGVDLLYSNMEILLPLPSTQLTTSPSEPKQTLSQSQDHPVLPPTAEWMECSDDGSPIKFSSRMRKMKKQHCVPGQDGLDSDSEDDFVSLHKPQIVSQSKEDVGASVVCPQVRRKPLTPEEKLKSLPVSQGLQSLGEFFDNLSCMDSMLGAPPTALRAGALVKDGMRDEARVETDRGSWMGRERSLEITAAVEALSFQKCCISAAEAWDKAKQFEGRLREEAEAELTLPVAAHRDSCSYTQEGPCQPQLIQKRTELMESLRFKGVCGTLCNRPAAAVEYLPALRTICRSEQLREQEKVKRRFLHYLDVIHLGLDKSTLRYLAGDFP